MKENDKMADLEAENRRLRAVIMQAENLEKGEKTEVTLQSRALLFLYVQAAEAMMAECNATNYVECNVRMPNWPPGDPAREYVLTVQRVGGLSPHQAREDAETKVLIAQNALDGIVMMLAGIDWTEDVTPGHIEAVAAGALSAIGDTSDLSAAKRRGVATSDAVRQLASIDELLDRVDPRETGNDRSTAERVQVLLTKLVAMERVAVGATERS